MFGIKKVLRSAAESSGFGGRSGKEELGNILPVVSFEEDVMILRNGAVAIGFELSSVEMENWSYSDYQNAAKIFESSLKSLPKGSVVQKLDIYFEDRIEKNKSDGFFENRYVSHFLDRPFIGHNSYFFIISPASKSKRYNETENTFVQYRNIKIEDSLKDIGSRMEDWKTRTASYTDQLNAVPGISLKKITDEGNKELYRRMLNMEFRYESPDVYKAIENKDNYLVIGDRKVNILSLVGQARDPDYARQNDYGVFSPFTYNIGIYYQEPHFVSRAYMVCDTDEELNRLDRESNLNYSFSGFGSDEGEIKSVQIKELTTDIRAHQGELVYFSMQVGIFTKGEQRRTEAISEIKGQILSWEGAEVVLESYNNTVQFFSCLPANAQQSSRWILMPSAVASTYMDFTTSVKSDPYGEYFADRFRNLCKVRIFNRDLNNQNFILIGPSGSGKSFTIGHIIIQREEKKIRQIIIDVGGTYKSIFDALGGEYFEYNPENPISFNPFLVPYDEKLSKYELSEDKINFLKSMFAYMLYGISLTREQSAVFDKLIPAYYAYEGEMRHKKKHEKREISSPCLNNMCNWIKNFYLETKDKEEWKLQWEVLNPEKILLIMEPFVEGVYKKMLNNPDVLDISEHRLVCFDMARVKDNKNLYPLVTMLLTELALDVIRKFPDDIKCIIMDEAWSMLSEGMGDFVESMFRTLRKANGQMGIITQGIDEIISSKVGPAIINNADTKIILNHTDGNTINKLCTHLGFTDDEKIKITSLRKTAEAREFFIKQGILSNVYSLEVPLEEMATLTSQPVERNHLRKLKERYLGNINNAIDQWVLDYKNGKLKNR